MTATIATLEARRVALFAKTSTPALVGAAFMLEAKTSLTEDERMALAWTRDEIETRCGGVHDDEAFCALLDTDMTYTEALIATFPELSR